MLSPITYTFNGVPYPKDRLAVINIGPTTTFVGTEVYPVSINTLGAKLYKCTEPNPTLKETRYINNLPELLALYPNTISTTVYDNQISYSFDPSQLPVTVDDNYSLEFTVRDDGTAHYVGKIVVHIV